MKRIKITKKKMVLIGVSACLLLWIGIPFAQADTGLPVDVGGFLIFESKFQDDVEFFYGDDRVFDPRIYSANGTVHLSLGKTVGNFKPLFIEFNPGWENWSYEFTDTHVIHSYPDMNETQNLQIAIGAIDGLLFNVFSMKRPFREGRKFPILFNETNWEAFPDDAQTVAQEFNDDHIDDDSYAEADAHSYTEHYGRLLESNITSFERIEYSDKGICANFTISWRRDYWDNNSHYIRHRVHSFILIDSEGAQNILSFPPAWLGVIILGSLVMISVKTRHHNTRKKT